MLPPLPQAQLAALPCTSSSVQTLTQCIRILCYLYFPLVLVCSLIFILRIFTPLLRGRKRVKGDLCMKADCALLYRGRKQARNTAQPQPPQGKSSGCAFSHQFLIRAPGGRCCPGWRRCYGRGSQQFPQGAVREAEDRRPPTCDTWYL